MNKYFLFLGILLSLFCVYADSNGVWIKAEDIRGGIFASDEGNGQFTFGQVPKLPLTYASTCTILSVDASGAIVCSTEKDTLDSVTARNSSTMNSLTFKLFRSSTDSNFGIDPTGNSQLNTLTAMGSIYVNGNIGIGTTTPGQKLEVLGTTKTNDLQVLGLSKSNSLLLTAPTLKNCAGKLITDMNGNVSCGVDKDVQTLSLSGNTLSISNGNSVSIDADLNNEKPLAGVGISVSDRTVSVDTNTIQKRVTGTCTSGINSIDSAGGVSCAPAPATLPKTAVYQDSSNLVTLYSTTSRTDSWVFSGWGDCGDMGHRWYTVGKVSCYCQYWGNGGACWSCSGTESYVTSPAMYCDGNQYVSTWTENNRLLGYLISP